MLLSCVCFKFCLNKPPISYLCWSTHSDKILAICFIDNVHNIDMYIVNLIDTLNLAITVRTHIVCLYLLYEGGKVI